MWPIKQSLLTASLVLLTVVGSRSAHAAEPQRTVDPIDVDAPISSGPNECSSYVCSHIDLALTGKQ